MNGLSRQPSGAFFVICVLLLGPAAARADEDQGVFGAGHWRALVSPFALHFRYSAEHKTVWAAGAEFQRDDDWLAGAAYFRNSFGQPSGYVYVGRRHTPLDAEPQLFLQWSAGILHGYRGKYASKVPLNVKGFAPGALASAGWQLDRQTSATLHLLGDAGLMLQLAHDFR